MVLLRSWPALGLLAAASWQIHQPCASLLHQGLLKINIQAPSRPHSSRQPHQRTPSVPPDNLWSRGATTPRLLSASSTTTPPSGNDANADNGNPSLSSEQKLTTAVTSPGVVTASANDKLGSIGRVSLWMDMRTAILPAVQTLRILYDELRRREEASGRAPDDPDWSLSRVPNPVAALLYASDPEGRAEREFQELGGALPCYRVVDNPGHDQRAEVLNVSDGNAVGVAIDTVDGVGDGGEMMGVGVVAAAVAAEGNVLLLDGIRPSAWVEGDAPTVVRLVASACPGSGKTLVVAVRSAGQLHDAAMATLAATQTKILGPAAGDGDVGGRCCDIAFLIEPVAELWEVGLLYL